MIADEDGLPKRGSSSARYLGVRYPADVLIYVDIGIVGPGSGGPSVSPDDPMFLPRHRRPSDLFGTGLDPVWSILESELGPSLQCTATSSRHALIEPMRNMSVTEFDAAIAETRSRWKLL